VVGLQFLSPETEQAVDLDRDRGIGGSATEVIEVLPCSCGRRDCGDCDEGCVGGDD